MAHLRASSTLLGASMLLAAMGGALAQPQQPKPVAQFGAWSVYASGSGNAKVCYAISQPKERLPAGLKRDPAFFFISTRPGEKVTNEVSLKMGFVLKNESEAKLTVGGQTFLLYTKEDGAWVRNVADENKLVDTLRKGKDVVVVSTSQRGNTVTDKFSLAGIVQALDKVAQECR